MYKKLDRSLLYGISVAVTLAFFSAISSAQTVLIGTNVNDGSFESITGKNNFSTPVSGTTSIPFWGATLVDVSNNPVGAPSDSGAQIGGNVVEQGGAGAYMQGPPVSTAFNLETNYVLQTGDLLTLTWWSSVTAPELQQVEIFSQSPSTVGATWAYQPTATLAVAEGGIYSGTGSFKQYTLTYQATAADAGNLVGITYGNAVGPGYSEFDNFQLTVQSGVLPGTPSANTPLESPSTASFASVAGTRVSLAASASGATPITYFWQTDGGTGGVLTNIPGAVGSNYVVNTTGFSLGTYEYNFIASNSIGTSVSSTVGIVIVPILMVDTGTTNAPTPGVDDISQLLNTSQNDDNLNYYTDNGANNDEWNGQTFTTGNNPDGYTLNTLYWKSAGNGNSFGAFRPYNLYIYSLSGGTATVVGSYTNIYGGGVENDWFEWVGLNTPLAPNAQYAYAFGRNASQGGWEHIGNQGGNPYTGGQICQIPSAGGVVTYGTTGGSDAAFDLGLGIATIPFAPQPTYTPNVTPIYAGTPVTLQESGVGAAPLSYQWLTDNGTGGTFSQVGGATSANLAVNTSAFAPGNYRYEVIVTNSLGNSTSAPVTLNIIAASAPAILTDINPSPANEGYVGQTLTFSAIFSGTLPITYQWMVDTGSGPQPISSSLNPSATNSTLILTNVQTAQAGTYSVLANNSQGSQPSSSATLTVLAIPGPPAVGTYGAAVLSNNPVAYWRFNEMEDPSTGVLPAYDATGHGFIGTYGSFSQNGDDGIIGPQPPLFPSFETTNAALAVENELTNSWVTVPPLNLSANSATVTITMWIYPTALEPTFTGLFYNRVSNAGFGFGGPLNGPGMAPLGYAWDNNASSTWSFSSGLYPPENQWSFAALVITPSNAKIYLGYEDPNNNNNPIMLSTNNPGANVPALFNSGVTTIGTDLQNPLGRAFGGNIDEVAVYNTALTPTQIYGLFNVGTGGNLAAPVPLTISPGTGGNLILNWNLGTLLQATSLNGPWTTNSAAVSPYSVTPTGAAMFFKIQ